MFCKNCGTELDDNAIFCRCCGVATDKFSQPEKTQDDVNVLAIVGFVLSFFSGIAGLICSVIGYKKICDCGGKGKPFAIAGITISIIRIVCVLIIVMLYVLAILGLFVIAAAWGAG